MTDSFPDGSERERSDIFSIIADDVLVTLTFQ